MTKVKQYDTKVAVALSKEQHKLIADAAARLGLPVGTYIRMAALEKVERTEREET